ncbi:MAG: hypothetical protein JKY54_17815 [Flavobacteriales bacterium]|nr:hypothetical protein [Flavobacteriales bacterium]
MSCGVELGKTELEPHHRINNSDSIANVLENDYVIVKFGEVYIDTVSSIKTIYHGTYEYSPGVVQQRKHTFIAFEGGYNNDSVKLIVDEAVLLGAEIATFKPKGLAYCFDRDSVSGRNISLMSKGEVYKFELSSDLSNFTVIRINHRDSVPLIILSNKKMVYM